MGVVAVTEEEENQSIRRSRRRERAIFRTSLVALLAKAISVGTTVVTVPITLGHLGLERYGMWMTMSSLVAMLSFADLGLGNALVNAVASAFGRNDTSEIRRAVSSATAVLSAIALGLSCIFLGAYMFIDWPSLFGVRSAMAVSEAGPAVAILFACFVANIPLGIVQRLQMGMQHGVMANAWQCVGSAFSLAAVLLAVHFKMGLPWLVAAMAGAPVAAALINGIAYFSTVARSYRPSLDCVSAPAAKRIASAGLLFLVLQVVTALSYSSDNVIVAQLVGPEAVAQYAVPLRLFSVVSIILGVVFVPLWPAYGEAMARGDLAWVHRTLLRSVASAAAFATVSGIILVVLGSHIVALWVGPSIQPSITLLVGLAAWQVIQSVAGAVAVFLNGVGAIRFQVVIAVATGVATIALKLWFVAKFGLSGAVWASVLGFITIATIPQWLLVRRVLNRGLK